MEYRICYPDELYHYGVKGMKWGVRKEPYTKDQIRQRRKQLVESAPYKTSRYQKTPSKGYWKNASDAQIAKLMDSEAKQARKANKKPMSTAKKVAIGIGVAAAVAGATYVGVKAYQTSKYNKAARAAVQRAIRSANKASSAYKPGMNLYKESAGHYKVKAGKSAIGSNIGKVPTDMRNTSGKIRRKSFGNLTGHSKRVTKVGAASYRAQFYNNKAQTSKWVGDSLTNASSDKRKYSTKANEAYKEYERLVKQSIGSGKGVPRRYNYYPVNKLRRQKKFKIIG